MKNLNTKKIAAIVIGIFIFIAIVYFAFTILGSRAANDQPTDVVVNNIQKNSTTLSWSTANSTQAVIEYGTTPASLNFFAPEAAAATANHTMDLTLLSPGTTYYFDIRIGDKKFDNGGVPWTFTTKNTESSVASPTATPAVSTASATTAPVQRIRIDDGTSACTDTDCAVIKTKLGKGCSTQDYFKCLNKAKPTP